VREPALELSRCPVKFVWADSLKFVELGPENSKIEIVAKINPHKNEECKVWTDERVVQVVQRFRGLAN